MNKRLLVLSFALALTSMMEAQDFTFVFGGDDLIKKTNGKAIAVVEQMYQLKDAKGNVYGLNGNEEFGETYSLGIVTEEGLIVTDKATHPWDYDPNYDQYKNDKNYEPVLYETDIKPFGEKDSIRMECTEETPKDLGVGCFLMPCFQSEEGGITLSDTTGKVDGWMVWAMHPTSNEITKDLDYHVYVVHTQSVDVKDNGFVVKPPQNMERAIGGFFVVPHITKVGSVCFELCGVAIKMNDDWTLQSVVQPKKKTEEKQPKVGSDNEEKPKPSGGKLTPAEKKGKKGKKK